MRGLRAKQVLCSEGRAQKDFRLEPEFYSAQTVLTNDSYRGEEVIEFLQYGTSNNLNEEGNGYQVLRLNEIENSFIKEPEKFCDHISEDEFEDLRIKKGDVLVCRTNGNPKLVGKSAVVMEDTQFAFASYLFRVRPNVSKISPQCLCIFLNSRPGRAEIEKYSIRSNQVNFSPDKIRQIRVPRLNKQFQDAIDTIVIKAYKQVVASKHDYQQAESFLLDALGLRNWEPPHDLTYQQTSSTAFAAGRLDAEHFQPKYAALVTLLQEHGSLRLGDYVCEPVKRGISPEYVEDGDVLVINSRHVGRTHVDVEDNRYTSRTLLEIQPQMRGEVNYGDVLLNSTGRDTIGRCQCLLENVEAVVDNHIAIIRPKKELDPVYLACFLNALPGYMQTESGWTGSSGQIELRPDVVEDYQVWAAPAQLQQEIRSKIEESHVARREAKRLLEAAKRAVEIVIEDSEAAALRFLEEINGAEE